MRNAENIESLKSGNAQQHSHYIDTGFIHSCYSKLTRSSEDFIQDHMIGYIISGEMTVIDGNNFTTYKKGSLLFYRKNQLAKFIKRPINGEDFESISLLLDKEFLLGYAQENNIETSDVVQQNNVLAEVKNNAVIKGLLISLKDDGLLLLNNYDRIKSEIVTNLCKNHKELRTILFEHSQPGKIPLKPFMNRNYRYNVPINKLAYMTGRSLATFKRDFEKIFDTSPSKWIYKKRLEEAYYLLKHKNKKPVDIYLDIGFESLSHFSYSFKHFFGVNPSKLPIKTIAS